MSIMYVLQQPASLAKNQATDDEKRFLMANSKKINAGDIAIELNRSLKWVTNACQRIGCGYTTKLGE